MIASYPKLAMPFTVIAQKDEVMLVAGEDFRYTFRGPALDSWAPGLINMLDGHHHLDDILANCETSQRDDVKALLERFSSERIIFENNIEETVSGSAYSLAVHGSGSVYYRLDALTKKYPTESNVISVFCQETLDFAQAVAFGEECRSSQLDWLWVSTGAQSRFFVSPLMKANAGPCLQCLLRNFERISPAPQVYKALNGHSNCGGVFKASSISESANNLLAEFVLWKLKLAAKPQIPPALFRLHVIESDSLEISSHRVPPDPECDKCVR